MLDVGCRSRHDVTGREILEELRRESLQVFVQRISQVVLDMARRDDDRLAHEEEAQSAEQAQQQDDRSVRKQRYIEVAVEQLGDRSAAEQSVE